MFNLWPTKKQYKGWRFPSKWTFIGSIVSMTFLLLTVGIIISNITFEEVEDISLQSDYLVESIDNITGTFTKYGKIQSIVAKHIIDKSFGQNFVEIYVDGFSAYKTPVNYRFNYIGLCYNEETGLDNIIYTMWNGAASGGLSTLVVSFDKDTNAFKDINIEAYPYTNQSLKEIYTQGIENNIFYFNNGNAVCNWNNNREGILYDIYKSMRPSEHYSNLKLDEEKKYLPYKEISEKLFSIANSDKDISIDIKYENKKWKIYLVEHHSFRDPVTGKWNSWGLLIGRNKITNKLYSFYNIPTGDSNKVDLYVPENIYSCPLSEDSSTTIDVDDYICMVACRECSWHGDGYFLMINLRKQTIEGFNVFTNLKI